MKPKITDIRKISKQRFRTISSAESELIDTTDKLQSNLYSFVANVFIPSLDIRDGVVVNSTRNLKKINSFSRLKSFVRKFINKPLASLYASKFKALNRDSNNYYSLFNASADSKKKIFNRAALGAEGFLDSLFDNNQVQKQIQDTLRGSVSSSLSVQDLQGMLKEQIEGTDKKLGNLSSFHYQNGRDEFSKYSNAIDEQFSQALNLNYAIYQGGEIKTTREFCLQRDGNVYNRETIASWQSEDWQGKMDGHDIFINVGGYNCRHSYGWITFEMAKRLDSSIEKSTFDK